jgi:hypothetical protein
MTSQPIWSDPIGLLVLAVTIAFTAAVVWGLARLDLAVRRARPLIMLAVVGLGGLAGYGVLLERSSWLASTLWLQFAFLILLGLAVSGLMMALPKTRALGRRGIVGVLLMAAAFEAVYLSGYLAGLHGWRGERPLPWQ